MKNILYSLGLLLLLAVGTVQVFAQDKPRIAVFDPTAKGIDEGIVDAVREMISSALVNTNKFNIVERSLLDKVMKEQKFSNSGAVDASQASELGKLAGANLVVVSVVTAAGARTMLSIKMIDVQSASIANQKVKTIKPDDLLDVVESLTLEMIGETPVAAESSGGISGAIGGAIGGFFGGGKKSGASKQEEPKPAPREEPRPAPREEPRPAPRAEVTPTTDKERFAARNEEELAFSSASSGNSKSVALFFQGAKNSKNPTCQLFLDGQLVGSGTLNQGFAVKFNDPRPGVHSIKIEWSGTVATKSFDINTAVKNNYTFEYATTGFGYALKMKD